MRPSAEPSFVRDAIFDASICETSPQAQHSANLSAIGRCLFCVHTHPTSLHSAPGTQKKQQQQQQHALVVWWGVHGLSLIKCHGATRDKQPSNTNLQHKAPKRTQLPTSKTRTPNAHQSRPQQKMEQAVALCCGFAALVLSWSGLSAAAVSHGSMLHPDTKQKAGNDGFVETTRQGFWRQC